MPVPSKNFTVQTDGQVDADSPGDTGLMTEQRDNDIHLEEWLGLSYTAAQDHDHDGTNSKLVTSVAASAVGQGELKTANQDVSTTSTSYVYTVLTGGNFTFQGIQLKSDNSVGADALFSPTSTTSTGYVQVQRIGVKTDNGGYSAYARVQYIQSSPPYKLGDTTWNHFLFMLRKVGTGDIFATYFAPDPPWQCNGKLWLPKDHKDRIAAVPHPFADYWDKDPATDGLEIVLVDLTGIDVAKWIDDNWEVGKSILEDLGSVLMGKGTDKAWSDYTVPTITRFTDRVKVITP